MINTGFIIMKRKVENKNKYSGPCAIRDLPQPSVRCVPPLGLFFSDPSLPPPWILEFLLLPSLSELCSII